MRRSIILAMISLIGSAVFAAPRLYAEDHCEVLAVRGQVFVTPDGGQRTAVNEGDPLRVGDKIEVEPQSYADIAFDRLHNNVSRIESDSEVTVRRIHRVQLKLARGGVFARLMALPTGSSFEVQTPTIVATVRGSAYRTTCEPGGASAVYNFSDSPVTVYGVDSAGNASGEATVLGNLEKTSAASTGTPPAAPERMSDADIEAATELQSALDETLGKNLGTQDEPGARSGAGTALGHESAEQALTEMAHAYESEDMAGFISRVSDSFAWRGELEEFIRRDFRDYDGIKLNFFFKRTVEEEGGASVRADWQLQFFPTATTSLLEVRGSDLDFVFRYENGRLKLKAMRGSNPLFGARSPEIAALSGVPSSVVVALQEIEDIGSRVAKQTAMTLVAESEGVSSRNVPVNFEILQAQVFTAPATTENVPGQISYGTAHQPQLQVRLVDNPRNVDLVDVVLEVTDSRTGNVMRGTGTLYANQTNIIRTTGTFSTATIVDVGTLTYVLDPDREFSIIDRSASRTSANYTSP